MKIENLKAIINVIILKLADILCGLPSMAVILYVEQEVEEGKFKRGDESKAGITKKVKNLRLIRYWIIYYYYYSILI